MSMYDISLPEGKYAVAVSGGIDSVALLHSLTSTLYPLPCTLTVAHVDHGIRSDSAEDAELVKSLAESYGLEFESIRLELGSDVSETEAREHRYKFLFEVCEKHSAKLITAHHQDDLIESAIINIVRGTGIYGLAPMLNNDKIIRPLIHFTKNEILEYAKAHNLQWREDSTNQQQKYLRNYIRANITPKLGSSRQDFLLYIYKAAEIQKSIESELATVLKNIETPEGLKRSNLLQLDFASLCHLMRLALINKGVKNINRKLIERASIAAKVLQPGKKLPLDDQYFLVSFKNFVKIIPKVAP